MASIMNIINSIAMSVTSRIKEYGAMRAVGMEEEQVKKMIAAEAFTYAISSCVVGTLIGLFFSKMMYQTLISSHFASATWTIPIAPLIFILTVWQLMPL